MQARSIHIGAGTFAWPGGDQPSPLIDVASTAVKMHDLCAKAGIAGLPPLVDDHATIAAVSDAIAHAATELEAGALLVITYAGHGAVRDAADEPGNDEPRDQAWCLHDGLLRDNDLRRLLAKVPVTVRILVISDACHMGSMNNAIGEPCGAQFEQLASRETVQRWFARDDAQRRAPRAPPTPMTRQARPDIVAPSIFLGACADDDLASPALFSRTLIDVWNGGEFRGDHQQYWDEIKTRMLAAPAQQLPTFTRDGTDVEAFVAQRPFTPGHLDTSQEVDDELGPRHPAASAGRRRPPPSRAPRPGHPPPSPPAPSLGTGRERLVTSPIAPPAAAAARPRAFIVHGRDLAARDELKKCLASLELDVEPFEQIADRMAPMPVIADVVRHAIVRADVIVVLFTPDEQTALFDPETARFVDNEPAAARWQARPNVIFEAGWAFGVKPDQTVFVSLGDTVALFADVGGHHVIRLDAPGGKAQLRRRLAPLCGGRFSAHDDAWLADQDTGQFTRYVRRRLPFHDDLGELLAKLSNMDVGRYNLLDLLVAVNEAHPGWRWKYRVPRDLVVALAALVGGETADGAHWWLASIGFFRFSQIDNWGDDWEESIDYLSFAPRSVGFLEWLRAALTEAARAECAERVRGLASEPARGGKRRKRRS